MRCFDPVWRLNLIAIHLKNIHRNKLIQILYGKPFTREFSPDSNVSGYKVSTFFPDSRFWDTSYNRDDFHRIRRCMCKRMYESDAKTFRFYDESGIFRSSVNVACVAGVS